MEITTTAIDEPQEAASMGTIAAVIDEQQTPGLLRIPRELVLRIYDYTTSSSEIIIMRAEETAKTRRSPALIRFYPSLPLAYVCHEIRDEYLKYYYKNKTIYFSDSLMEMRILTAFIARYGEEAKLIKSVKVYAKFERKYSYAVEDNLPTTRRFPFEVRFQMSEKEGAVTVQDLQTTEYMDARDGKMRGLCCCYLSQMAASGLPRVGGLVGILRCFLGAATGRDGGFHHTVDICRSCGNYRPLLVRRG